MKAVADRPGEPRGFTLIELMVVLALIGTLWGLVAPSFRRAFEREKAEALLDDFRDALVAAQAAAISARRPTRMDVDPSTGRWGALIWRPDEKALVALEGRRRSGSLPSGWVYDASGGSFVFYPDGSAGDFDLTVRTPLGDDVGRLTVSPLTGSPVWSAHGK